MLIYAQGAAPSNLSCVRHGLADDIGPRPGDRMQDASVAISDLAAAAKGFDTKDWPEVTALYAVSTLCLPVICWAVLW